MNLRDYLISSDVQKGFLGKLLKQSWNSPPSTLSWEEIESSTNRIQKSMWYLERLPEWIQITLWTGSPLSRFVSYDGERNQVRVYVRMEPQGIILSDLGEAFRYLRLKTGVWEVQTLFEQEMVRFLQPWVSYRKEGFFWARLPITGNHFSSYVSRFLVQLWKVGQLSLRVKEGEGKKMS